jgi:hypothetical protein
MKINLLVILVLFCQTIVFAQDKKVTKISKYLEKGKGSEAKELLDELDNIKTYQTDINYWFVRTVYYRNIALDKPNTSNELAEARKSFEKLVELDKTDVEKSFTVYIPQFKKDLFEGKNKITKAESKSSSGSVNESNDGKTVTLTLIGQGKTKDAAKYNALRNALEKAFGTFISSNTTLLNDELIKDEIVSVSSGNIQNFEILSETQMPDGSYSSVVKATVSIVKLTSFCESKGIVVEFKGGLFAANEKLKKLKKENQAQGQLIYKKQISEIIKNGIFDYSIEVSEPNKHPLKNDIYLININVKGVYNNNFNKITELIESYQKGLDLNLYFNFYNDFRQDLKLASEKFIISNNLLSLKFSDILTILKSENNNILKSYQWQNAAEEDGVFKAFINSNRIEEFTFTYSFNAVMTLDEISNITEYKIQTINK